MKRIKNKFIPLLFFVITALFFYKTFLHGLVPFPGDLLISEYNPWKSYSFLGYVPGSFPNKAQYFDVIRQLYPWKTFVVNALQSGQFPLWNPYNFSGSPLFANIQSAVLYPLNIFYLIFPKILGWSLLVFLQPFFAGLFTYLYARKIKLTKIPSLFAAISFAFSSFLSVWLEYNTIDQVILWLPLVLLSTEQFLEGKIRWGIIFVFALVAASFAGHLQIFAYGVLFVLFYSGHRIITKDNLKFSKKKSLVLLSGLVLFSFGIGAIQLLPTLQLISYSARSAHAYDTIITKILIQPWQLIMLIVPDFFGNPATRNYLISDTYVGKVISIGVIGFFFAILGMLQIKANILVRFFTGAAVVILLLSTNNPLTQILYHFNIPFFSSSAPTLSVFIFCFSMSILAGFGMEKILQKKLINKDIITWFAAIGGIVLLFFVTAILETRTLLMEHKTIPMHAIEYVSIFLLIFIFVLFAVFIKRKLIVYGIIILLLVQTFDLFHASGKFNPFVPRELIFPDTKITSLLENTAGINRVWGYRAANIEANIQTFYHIYSSEGYDPLYPKWYGEFIQSSQDGKIHTEFTDATRSDARIIQQMSPVQLSVLDILGTKYILDKDENGASENIFPTSRFKLIYADSGWKIFENVKSLPRFFLTDSYQVYNSNEDFSQKFFNQSKNPKTILLTNSLPIQLSPLSQKSTAHLISYTPNKITFQTTTNGNALLFLSDTYYPGWVVRIDGKVTKIYKADYTFRAIVVPQGEHTIIFTFAPESFKIGIVISLISLILFFGTFLIASSRGVKRHGDL